MRRKTKKQTISLLILCTLCILTWSGTVSGAGFFQSDDANDVCLIRTSDNQKICNQTYPGVDILKVARSYSNETLQLIIILNGQIEEINQAYYKLWYNTSGNNSVYRYMMNYSQTGHTVEMINPNGTKTMLNVTPQIMSNNHMISVSIPQGVVKFNENLEAVAISSDESGKWIDQVTNVKKIDPIPFNGTSPDDLINGDNANPDDSGSIPGFTILLLIASIGVVFGIYQRKRQK